MFRTTCVSSISCWIGSVWDLGDLPVSLKNSDGAQSGEFLCRERLRTSGVVIGRAAKGAETSL